jgi:hypothetical protein
VAEANLLLGLPDVASALSDYAELGAWGVSIDLTAQQAVGPPLTPTPLDVVAAAANNEIDILTQAQEKDILLNACWQTTTGPVWAPYPQTEYIIAGATQYLLILVQGLRIGANTTSIDLSSLLSLTPPLYYGEVPGNGPLSGVSTSNTCLKQAAYSVNPLTFTDSVQKIIAGQTGVPDLCGNVLDGQGNVMSSIQVMFNCQSSSATPPPTLTPTSTVTSTATPTSAPQVRPISITWVNVARSGGGYIVTVRGSGFGNPPVPVPFTGYTPDFRIADAAQLGHGEWGYTGDGNTLTYLVWSDQEVQVARLGTSPGDAIELALWNPTTGLGVTWGGTVPPAPTGSPQITSVDFTGSGQTLQITIHGSGFGPAPGAMPFTGDLNNLTFGDFRTHCGGSALFEAGGARWGIGSHDPVTLHYVSWSDTTIQIAGFSGQYGQGCASVQSGDPVTIEIWNSNDAGNTGPQTAWCGTLPG